MTETYLRIFARIWPIILPRTSGANIKALQRKLKLRVQIDRHAARDGTQGCTIQGEDPAVVARCAELVQVRIGLLRNHARLRFTYIFYARIMRGAGAGAHWSHCGPPASQLS